ncbi:MAG: hypothetical protein ACRCTR_08430 [Actinomycetota bacterium]
MNMAPRGWYPQSDGNERYWSGQEWTDYHRESAPNLGLVHPTQPIPTVFPLAPYGGQTVPGYYPNGMMAPPYVVAPKNAGVALLASFFIPGLGQFINGDAGKGAAMLVVWFLSFFFMIIFIGFATLLAVWLWAMIDAYTSAQRWNLERGIVS